LKLFKVLSSFSGKAMKAVFFLLLIKLSSFISEREVITIFASFVFGVLIDKSVRKTTSPSLNFFERTVKRALVFIFLFIFLE